MLAVCVCAHLCECVTKTQLTMKTKVPTFFPTTVGVLTVLANVVQPHC